MIFKKETTGPRWSHLCSAHLTTPRCNTISPKERSSPPSLDASCQHQQEICYRGLFHPPEEHEVTTIPSSLPSCLEKPSILYSSSELLSAGKAECCPADRWFNKANYTFKCFIVFLLLNSHCFLLIIILRVCCTFSNLSLFGKHFSVFQTSVYFIKLLNILLY